MIKIGYSLTLRIQHCTHTRAFINNANLKQNYMLPSTYAINNPISRRSSINIIKWRNRASYLRDSQRL